mgnify:CR=1 FL=1
MAKAFISYDRDLPEIPDRCPWLKPNKHLVKDSNAPLGWRVADGRRPSNLLLVEKLRAAVDDWRAQGYRGASEATRRLFEYWFEEDHDVPGFGAPFRYHFGQREAMETLAYVVEIAANRDAQELITSFGRVTRRDLYQDTVVFQTTMDGGRQVRRYFEELDAEGVQDLPPENLRRYAFKMATGSGKTWVMAMAIVWSYFHRRMVPGSDLSTNFLIVAPNVIVYQRLEKDFASNRIFQELPLVPPEWRPLQFKVILRGDSAEPDPSSNLFLTNIQQLYESRDQGWTPQNAVEALLGRAPQKDLTKQERSMLERIRSLKELAVLNDEAHHVHDEDLEWSRSLMSIHQALPNGLALWLDFSATPKDQNGMYFPWIICDYPLAQAVEDRIVKAPLNVSMETDPRHPGSDPDRVTGANAVEKYGFWIEAAVRRWKAHYETYSKMGVRPVLFIMTENTAQADAIGEHLHKTKQFGFRESEVLVIHTDAAGVITKKDLDLARQAARDIDLPDNRIKVIVSVMMLREGWDVRNVTVCLGLRPFTARAEILPEQVIGRGLRLMRGVSPDRTQTLEVLGTKNLLDLLREKLEAEGVGVTTTTTAPPPSVIIEPIQERAAYDIALPITKPSLTHDMKKLSDLKVEDLQYCIEFDASKPLDIRLRMEFAPTETEVHRERIEAEPFIAEDLLSAITNKVMALAGLPNMFSQLYPLVRRYVAERCFRRPIDLEDKAIRTHLQTSVVQECIARYLAQEIGHLTVVSRKLEFEHAAHRLSQTKPFVWRRNLQNGPLECRHTIFNYVATYNDFERRFAEFLDRAADVARFAALGTTQQGDSATEFRVDYLKPSGAIGFYHPDWVVVQSTPAGEVHWIIETKGRVWEDTAAKDAAMEDWCRRVTEQVRQQWRFKRVNQTDFDARRASTLAEVTAS